MSQNASMQYFVGEFDGVQFKNENTTTEVLRPDYGPDYYAAIAYNQLPTTVLPTAIGWLNNWYYANDIPTSPWKSAMSLPRNLSVKKINNEWILLQKPVAAVNSFRKKIISLGNEVVTENKLLPVKSTQFEMELSIEPSATSVCGIKLARSNDHFFEIGYDAAKQLLYIDRSKTGNTSFNENFKKMNRFEKNIALKNKKLHLHIYFDNSVVEIFVNDGEAVFTAQIFPDEPDNGIELFNTGGKSKFSNINFWEMKTAW